MYLHIFIPPEQDCAWTNLWRPRPTDWNIELCVHLLVWNENRPFADKIGHPSASWSGFVLYADWHNAPGMIMTYASHSARNSASAYAQNNSGGYITSWVMEHKLHSKTTADWSLLTYRKLAECAELSHHRKMAMLLFYASAEAFSILLSPWESTTLSHVVFRPYPLHTNECACRVNQEQLKALLRDLQPLPHCSIGPLGAIKSLRDKLIGCEL